ncbi:MAG: TraB/GumN family protein [Sphingomonadaceae bacterium]|nr:TraB/GumN family protein [Sphingomonadaceae bacterium]
MTKLFAPIIALSALLLQSCAPIAQTQGPASTASTMIGDAPALWRVADEDTTIWLFGTIHVLPVGFEWRNARIDAAVAASDELIIETVLSGETSESAMLLMRLGVAPNLPPVAERIPAEHREQLAAMIARGPFPETFLNGLETWAASLMLVGVTLNDLGLDPSNGVEDQLQLAFQLADKPISGFETPAQQLGYFDDLPEDAQRQFLLTVIDTPADIRAEFDGMLEAWVHGDEAAIAATFDDELQISEILREALLTRRNADWARQIAARLDRPGTAFIAVGAGHLVGRDSVQQFLAEAGIETQRIQ